MRNRLLSAGLALGLLSGAAGAVVITDGDEFDYTPGEAVVFNAVLSAANPTVTFGANVELGERFDVTVTAPTDLDLLALLSTGPEGSGAAIVNPTTKSMVFAGTSFTFPIDGNFFLGRTHWLTVSLDGIPNALDYLATLPGGELPVGGFLSSPEQQFVFSDGSTNPGNGSGGNPTGQVATPTPLLLFLSVLAGLAFRSIFSPSPTTCDPAPRLAPAA